MNACEQLQNLGQSLWLDAITRDLLDQGTLQRYIDENSITGLTSNPTIFLEAINGTAAYDQGISERAAAGQTPEESFMSLAIEDLRRAADCFRPVFDATDGVDGWVSLEVSPLLAADGPATLAAALRIHDDADRANLFVKIAGTPAGIEAVEETIFAGVPVNVTLLFSRTQYLAASEAYLRGIERRVEAGLDPRVGSVASLFVSRWDKATAETTSAALHNRLGVAIAGRCYRAYRQLLTSARWQRLADAGARPQRLLWASTGTKDPNVSALLYVEALAAPDTVNTMPQKTLQALAREDQHQIAMAADGVDAAATLALFTDAGVDLDALAGRLQLDGVRTFAESWQSLMQSIVSKSRTHSKTAHRSRC